LATTPLLWLVGASIAASYGSGKKLSAKESLKTFIGLPPVWGLVLGFAVNFAGFKIPGFLMKTLDLLSMPIVPMMIFSVGLALCAPKIKETAIVLPAVIIKLCFAPLAAYTASTLFKMGGLALKSSVMEAAMPSMVLTMVIASQFKLNHKLAALTIAITTASSFITLPIVSHLLR
ncbi:MAG: AEC family transporter, partial [Endomicrobium sp.]|nr:AEC family transporter [Endomicrobium sp.]